MAHLRWKWSTIILMKAKINRAIRKPRHGNLGIGTGIEIGTDITNAIISRSIRPMTPRLSRWWLRMRGPHPQSHMTLQYRVTRQIRNVISPLLQCGGLGWEDPTHKVTWHFDYVVMWQIKNLMSPHTQGPCPQGADLEWWSRTQKVTWHFIP